MKRELKVHLKHVERWELKVHLKHVERRVEKAVKKDLWRSGDWSMVTSL